MKKMAWLFCLLALAFTVPAMASSTLYSNLGTGTNVYNCCTGWTISGTGTVGESFTAANEFAPTASGSVTQLDFGVGYVTGVNSFYVSLYSNSGGAPGTKMGEWDNLSSSTNFGSCCGLVTITGITGINLTAGTDYWFVIGPMSTTSTTWEAWNLNSTGALGTDLYATSGCSTGGAGCVWNSNGTQTIGAFDVLGTSSTGTTPEPASLLLFGTGLFGVFGAFRRKINR